MPGYREIFGGERPLIGQVDALLTSISTDNRPWHFYGSQEIAEVARLDTTKLCEMAVGDIAGVLQAQPGREKRVADVMKCWTGIGSQDLERLSQKGRRREGPGIVVVAAGENKAACLERVLKLANILVIDDHLAKALNNRLKGRIGLP
jgi:DNA-binding transcriptional regulator LsrR (DeoR family)